MKPYFSLIGAVKRVELENFQKVLEEFKEEYFSMNLYFIVRRMINNVIQEGNYIITVWYSEIAIESIEMICIEYLIHKVIKDKII